MDVEEGWGEQHFGHNNVKLWYFLQRRNLKRLQVGSVRNKVYAFCTNSLQVWWKISKLNKTKKKTLKIGWINIIWWLTLFCNKAMENWKQIYKHKMCSVFGCNNPVHKVCVLNIFLGAGILAQQLRVYTVLVQNQNLLARNCAPAHPLPSSGRYGQLQSHVTICHIGTYKHNLKSMHTYTLKACIHT